MQDHNKYGQNHNKYGQDHNKYRQDHNISGPEPGDKSDRPKDGKPEKGSGWGSGHVRVRRDNGWNVTIS